MINIERIFCLVDITEDSVSARHYAAAINKAYNVKRFICYCAAEIAPLDLPWNLAAINAIEHMVERSIALQMKTWAYRWGVGVHRSGRRQLNRGSYSVGTRALCGRQNS